uniref:Uncharacterized protein n=1 Tax=Cacopsylla melanoneura TaxID=428564 RepID=A0A8D8QB41_9HEMI
MSSNKKSPAKTSSVRPILPRPSPNTPIMVAPGPSSGLRILQGSNPATQFLLVPTGSLQQPLTQLHLTPINANKGPRKIRMKPEVKQHSSAPTVFVHKPAPPPLVRLNLKVSEKVNLEENVQQELSSDDAPDFLWSKESKNCTANRVQSYTTTKFLETMLQPDILNYIKKTESKRDFFIRVYEELEKKGFQLGVESAREGGEKVWQKWRNLERKYIQQNVKLYRGKNKTPHQYPHYNFILIGKISQHLQKNEYKARIPKTNNNIELKSGPSKVIILRSALKSNDSSLDEVDKNVDEFNDLNDEFNDEDLNTLNTYVEEQSEGEHMDDDGEIDEELLKQFECDMQEDEDISDENGTTNDHEYARESDEELDIKPCPSEIKCDTTNITVSNMNKKEPPPSNISNRTCTANSHSSICCSETHRVLTSVIDLFNKSLQSRDQMMESMKQLITEQKCAIQEANEERKKTNALLEQVLKVSSQNK